MACNGHVNIEDGQSTAWEAADRPDSGAVPCICDTNIGNRIPGLPRIPYNVSDCITHTNANLCITHYNQAACTSGHVELDYYDGDVCPGHVYMPAVPATVWTNIPLKTTITIKSIHHNELRDAIHRELVRRGGTWPADPGHVSSAVGVLDDHIKKLRNGINAALTWPLPVMMQDVNCGNDDIVLDDQYNTMRTRINFMETTCICQCAYACTCDCDYCTCDCYYCTCNCAYACTCDCNYCTCDCNYCTCNCNYTCTCNCAYA